MAVHGVSPLLTRSCLRVRTVTLSDSRVIVVSACGVVCPLKVLPSIVPRRTIGSPRVSFFKLLPFSLPGSSSFRGQFPSVRAISGVSLSNPARQNPTSLRFAIVHALHFAQVVALRPPRLKMCVSVRRLRSCLSFVRALAIEIRSVELGSSFNWTLPFLHSLLFSACCRSARSNCVVEFWSDLLGPRDLLHDGFLCLFAPVPACITILQPFYS